ncbi:hypothetical protein LPJ61_003362 [Coemansia biformis]|uniref:AMP-dependent synthetase/ligase domain-containing protein n=1 Tax=Coemansia biformis TaxID=1286918 RepID=A0A9W7YE08_9FUNG|nr:hypothetical protein LPJ61_003362 [Coemansia biformis]
MPLLIDAQTGHALSFDDVRQDAAALAESLSTRFGVGSGDSIAVLAHANVDIPIVAIAAWTVCASVVVLPPEVPTDELRETLAQQHLPQVFFVSREFLPATRQVVDGIVLHAPGSEPPHFVVFDAEDGDSALRDDNRLGARAALDIRSLYYMHPGDLPPGRPPLSRSESEDATAVIYFHYHQASNGTTVTPSHMSHRNIIDQYNSSLRRSPSLPSRQSPPAQRSATPPDRPATPHTQPWRSTARFLDADAGTGDHTQVLAFAALRMHWAYRLHRTVLNIFCLGAHYVVAPSFSPLQFIAAVDRYSIACAELTFAEIEWLLDYLQQTRSESAGLLAPLRLVYTESDRAEAELAPRFAWLLPRVSIVHTRFGSYVEPLSRSYP